jgi:undecaprenyl-diphosphatase
MIFFTDRIAWFPAYLVLVLALGYYFGRRAFLLLPVLLLSVGLADVISSRFFKPYFARLRPCHDAELSTALNLANGCGGRFGFISSHAANSFTLAVFLCLALPRRFWLVKVLIVAWATMVSYSRIYLAAHYPTDVLAGAALGSVLAAGGYWFYCWVVSKWA